MMKKLFSLLLALCLVLPIAGCGKKQGDPVRLEIWHYYNSTQKAEFDRMVEEFNATVGLDKNIVAVADSKSSVNGLAADVVEAADKHELPSMFMTYSDTAFEIEKRGMLAKISDYMTDEELDAFLPSYIEEGRITDEAVKIFPIAKATEVLILNKTDFDAFAAEYNADKAEEQKIGYENFSTNEGIVAMAEAYNAQTGKALFGRDAIANYLLGGMLSCGAELFSVKDNGAAFNLDADAFKIVWDNYAVPYLKGHFALSDRHATGDIKTGALLSLVGSTSSCTYFPQRVNQTDDEDQAYEIEALVLPAPTFAGMENVQIQQGAGICVAKSDAATEAASVEFLKWFTETDRNIRFALSTGYLPVKKDGQDMQRIRSVIEAEKLTVDQINLETMEVAFQQIRQARMYANKPFEGGVAARNVLEEFKNYLAAQRAKILDEKDPLTIEDAIGNAAREAARAQMLEDLEVAASGGRK